MNILILNQKTSESSAGMPVGSGKEGAFRRARIEKGSSKAE